MAENVLAGPENHPQSIVPYRGYGTVTRQMNQSSAWQDEGFALIRCNDTDGEDCWLHCTRPERVLSARSLDEVTPALLELQRAVAAGYHAVGYIAYEAAAAFDPALVTHEPAAGPPLVWFGLYAEVAVLQRLDPVDAAPGSQIWTPSVTLEEYGRKVQRIKEELRAGNTYQVNYSLRFHATADADPFAAFVARTEFHSAPYAAFINSGDHLISSQSPELFFLLDGDGITCRPMKGTAPRGLTREQDDQNRRTLIESEKDRAENLMIVDMIRNDLGRIAQSGSIQVSCPFAIETYETLFQMTTTVSARTGGASLHDVLVALFPSASITGAPKVNTMKLIRELEPEARGVYTGTIGYISPERYAQFNVAIRTTTIHRADGRAVYGSGSGIVWDSDPAGEYQECLTKTRIISEPHAPFALLETLRWTPEEGYFLLEYHLARLASSAQYFLFRFDEASVRRHLASLSDRLLEGVPKIVKGEAGRSPGEAADTESAIWEQAQRIRLTLTKRGLIESEATPLDSPGVPPRKWKVAISENPVDREDPRLYHKTTHREIYRHQLAANPGLDDVILCNGAGEITESCVANLVAVKDGRHYTPPVDCGLLGGTYRQYLIDRGELTERRIAAGALTDFDEVYLVNSVRGRIDIELVPPPD